MLRDNLRNIVVLKNIPSNMVEEAIVIVKAGNLKESEKRKDDKEVGNKEYIIEEAKRAVTEYIDTLDKKEKEIKITKKKRIKNTVLYISVIGMSILLFLNLIY